MSEENTRPVSVAELLARNGTIGSPPVGGHRRRKRRNAVSVAELTGEIPVIRTGEIPVVVEDEAAEFDEPETFEDAPVEVSSETVVVYSSPEPSDAYVEETAVHVAPDYEVAPDYSDYQDYTPGFDEPAASVDTVSYEEAVSYGEAVSYVEAVSYQEAVSYGEAVSYEEAVSYAEAESDDGAVSYAEAESHDEATEYVEYAETAYAETASYVEPMTVASYVEPTTDEDEPQPGPDFALETAVGPEVIMVTDEDVAERQASPLIEEARPPLSSIPLPRRRREPQRSHDPRPRRRSPEPARPASAGRSSGAEQMSPDPMDQSVDLAELVAEQAPDGAGLRSYLKSSTATLFFGETVADDLARRGELAESGDGDNEYGDDYRDDHGGDYGDDYDTVGGKYERNHLVDDGVDDGDAPRRGALSVLGTSLLAVLQSLLAVVFGAGLFIGFDQLWRWNNIVALALSALVIAALMIGVHVVRKTEDFVSTLIAALVGILVTFGPLALQST